MSVKQETSVRALPGEARVKEKLQLIVVSGEILVANALVTGAMSVFVCVRDRVGKREGARERRRADR